ncbi:Putative uncharacterized protein [Taphrina deformans PYCC 5710]|uniref:Uncharacterized protein n=1 Tax=Taphrina deformans (strain PYCC 5710 / ATCC 11124 / CBS 356.35 / IMI 108563 / JCM 9778 / NBRC 8474) TaxID=1097556 RepID=R4XIQ6_TAPDE|nr:Putative uncharacterized protein [Taphrina deformans PYCC 5710]|eukprot:CCG83253.1 Putative uncharacterized protein [Taphrina deformans PYCC 5710]
MADGALHDSVTVEAAFISANAASYIASTYTANVRGTKPPTLTLDRSCLRSLNAFLDYFLAIIIKDARSIGLQDLKATLAKVLDSALGYVALNEAQAELETYRNQETGAGRPFEHSTSGSLAGQELFDVEAVWLQARIRCMIYSTVGEKEETDFPTLSNDSEIAVTPPVAIFLTAILEFLGEHILLTSARFARDRIGSSNKGILTEDDLDRGIKMDKALGTIWQSYLTIIPRQPSTEVLRKRDSGATDGSRTERIFSTLPFSSTKQAEIAGSPRNMDQYEQLLKTSDPARTPVLLRKASPKPSDALPGGSEEHPTRSPTTTATANGASKMGPGDLHPYLEPEGSRTSPETTSQNVKGPKAATLTNNNGYEGQFVTSPLQPNRAPATKGSEISPQPPRDAEAASNLPQQVEPFGIRSVASSVYGGNNDAPKVEPPLVSTGLWSRRKDQEGLGPGSTSKTLWTRPQSVVHQSMARSESSANRTTVSPGASTSEGFESGLFSWNANRESTSATSTPQKKPVTSAQQNTVIDTRSQFRDVYETVYAEQTKLSPVAPSGFQTEIRPAAASTTADSSRNTEHQKDKRRAPPKPIGNVGRTSLETGYAPRKAVNMSLLKPKAVLPISPREVPADFGARQGLGLRQLSEVEPGSDYEAFLRSEMAREKGARTGAVDANAQRSRIVANRAAALATSEAKNGSSTASRPDQIETVQNPSTPPVGLTLSEPFGRKASNLSEPRSPTASTEPSQTLRLAEFLRTTGPERATPRAVPLMSVAPARGPERNPQVEKLEGGLPGPVKLVKSETRTPIDGTDEDEDDDTGSWDEDLYGPNPRQKKGETMTDFLKNVPPPPSITQPQPQRRASLLQKIPSLGGGGRANGKPSRGPAVKTGLGDELIAGPAYRSPIAETAAFPAASSPPVGLFVPGVVSSTNAQHLPTPTGPASLKNTKEKEEAPGSPRARTTRVRDQRAVSRTAPQSDDEEDEEETLSDDDSIYGNPRRKPVKKESMADFLKNTSPPGYGRGSPKKGSRADGIGSSPPSRSIGRISRRISSLSVFVGGVGGSSSSKKNGPPSPATPTNTSPQRPNHLPLLP